MKVMQVTPEFPPPLVGGGAYHVFHLTKELVRRSIDVTVVTCTVQPPSFLKKTMVETQLGHVRVHRVPSFYIPGTIYSVAPRLIPELLTRNPDIIHAHGYETFTSDTAAMLSRKKNRPLVLTLHGFPESFGNLKHLVHYALVGKKTLETARRIIAVSETVAREFRNMGIQEDKIVIIPNGVDTKEYEHLPSGSCFRQRLHMRETDKMIFSVGRLGRMKGFQYLISAMQQVQKEVDQTKLVIAGPEFDYSQQLRSLVREMNLVDNVTFYGPIDEREKLEALAAADLVVVPSLYEACSSFLLEAIAAKRPVVATKTGIANDLVKNGTNGFLVETANAKQISDAIVSVFKSNLRRCFDYDQLVIRGFDWKNICDRVLEIYCLASECKS